MGSCEEIDPANFVYPAKKWWLEKTRGKRRFDTQERRDGGLACGYPVPLQSNFWFWIVISELP
jgi:hypothetical protein